MNVAAVVAGTAIGLLFGRLVPERVRTTAMAAIGLTVLGLGLQMAIDPRIDPVKVGWQGPLPYHPNPLVVIGGLVLGGIIGELLAAGAAAGAVRPADAGAGGAAPARPGAGGLGGGAGGGEGGHDLVEGFVTASLLYCVGAMAVIGAIQDAAGQPEVLYVKALLDGVSRWCSPPRSGRASGSRPLSLLVYQGGITLAAGAVAGVLTLPVLATLTSTGGLLIAAIGLDLLGVKRLPIGNLLPGVFVAAALAAFFG